MSDASPSSSPPPKRRWLLQFGMRTVLVLIVVAALAAWWARGEMLKEQRREDLLATLQKRGNALRTKPEATWRRRFGAWLRGKPSTPKVEWASLLPGTDLPFHREFVDLFPETDLSLAVGVSELSPEMRNFLAQRPSIDTLVLTGPIDLTDEFIAWLAKLPVKKMLEFSVDHLDDEVLCKLADAKVDPFRVANPTEGTEETEGWSLVTDEGLKAASRFPKLRYICAGPKASDEGIAAFKDHAALAFVELIGPGYTDASAEVLATRPNLHSVTFSNTRLTDAGIAKVLRNNARISSLRLYDTRLGEESIAAISSMKVLRSIRLRHVPLSPALASALAKHSIVWIHLDGDYSDADVSLLAPLAPTLTKLSLETPNVTDQGVAWLAAAGKLNSLQLFDTQVTATTVKLVKPALTSVTLGGPHVCEAFLPQANRSFTPTSVRLCGSAIDDNTLSSLEPPYQLLELVGTRATAAGLRSLKTDGKEIPVFLWFVEGESPPLTQQEIEEIKQATGGLVNVVPAPMKPALFESSQPGSSRNQSAEGDSP